MAGSRKWFIYTADNGTDYAIEADESNVEAFAAGTQDYPVSASAPVHAVPRNIKPRHAVFGGATQGSTIKVPIITQTIYNALTGASTMIDPLDPSLTLALLYKRPEQIRLPKGIDTGKADGDAT
jgi:hypothetical protein